MKPGPEYYSTQRWRIIRSLVIKRDNHKCQQCNADEIHALLHVHHFSYENVGTSREKDDCTTLCQKCHDKLHEEYNQRIGKLSDEETNKRIDLAYKYLLSPEFLAFNGKRNIAEFM